MKDLFLEELTNQPLSFIASKWIFEKIPFVFEDDREAYIRWKEKLSQKINIDSASIIFTGSSGCGFSLNPFKNYKKFDEDSDIDLALISSHYFDISWHALRSLGTKYYSLTPKQKASVKDHQGRLIYWGTIATDKILSILPFGKKWTIALIQMSQDQPFEGRTINIRIYKDFESLRAYHTNNLDNLRQNLLKDN